MHAKIAKHLQDRKAVIGSVSSIFIVASPPAPRPDSLRSFPSGGIFDNNNASLFEALTLFARRFRSSSGRSDICDMELSKSAGNSQKSQEIE